MGQGTGEKAYEPPKGVIWEYVRSESLFSIANKMETKLSLIGHFLDLRDTSQPF